jgi:hypothetical protein
MLHRVLAAKPSQKSADIPSPTRRLEEAAKKNISSDDPLIRKSADVVKDNEAAVLGSTAAHHFVAIFFIH